MRKNSSFAEKLSEDSWISLKVLETDFLHRLRNLLVEGSLGLEQVTSAQFRSKRNVVFQPLKEAQVALFPRNLDTDQLFGHCYRLSEVRNLMIESEWRLQRFDCMINSPLAGR
jgi:hypothetical protein